MAGWSDGVRPLLMCWRHILLSQMWVGGDEAVVRISLLGAVAFGTGPGSLEALRPFGSCCDGSWQHGASYPSEVWDSFQSRDLSVRERAASMPLKAPFQMLCVFPQM